ncbi:hypothetical protein GCM10007968_28060 [Sporolactobacillus putidus]|uniref:Uncharacterized protein n=1 Tax=Sporolactobacillus putidus TaxID=492735 RepID=A0A917S995_9BACL|nr:hypothetical protein GCM10007968_28060 [Sporolactobacillus putidus]
MPSVKKLYQESEDVSKAAFIFGHLWGSVGILTGNAKNVLPTARSSSSRRRTSHTSLGKQR